MARRLSPHAESSGYGAGRVHAILATICGWLCMVQAGAAQPEAASSTSTSQPATGTSDPGYRLQISDKPKLLAPLPPPPADADPPSAEARNFEGTWLATAKPDEVAFEGEAPPYTEATAMKQRRKMEMRERGTPIAGLEGTCRPINALRLGADLFPAEIVQSPDELVILNEEGRTRWQIFLNRGHPKNLQPSYWGDSVGHWEGDTLVVDVIGFNGKQDLLSARAHVSARIRKADNGQRLEMRMTTEDPEHYTKPFVQTVSTLWHPEVHMLEYQCEENAEGAREGLIFE